MPNEPTPIPSLLGGRYQVERELGRGGMACVYLARDLKHARQVAVKVILPELAATVGRDRFLREIAVVANLRHPNIIPLFDSGESDGLLYFVMPYETGASLGDRLAGSGPLGIAETVGLLRDVARALAYAHEHGVVHRDIKPDNVLMSGGAAVVTDFGIAKALTVAQTQSDSESITQTGAVIGTAAYMAPEQRLADPTTDHRADIYAFGCLGFELLTGEAPFAGVSGYQILAAQMQTAARPVTALRPDVPPALTALLARCLEREPDDRPQQAAELVEALQDPTLTSGESVAKPVPRRTLFAVLGAFLIAAAFAFWLLAPRRLAVDPGAVVALPTVAVLPFRSTGGDSNQAVLAEGLGDDLATGLVRVDWLRVMSRRGTENYGGQGNVDYQAAGEALGARYLVVGTLRLLEGRRTLTAELINSDDLSTLWREKFDADTGLLALRDSIVAMIGEQLRPRDAASTSTVARGNSRPPNSEAYALYLIGKRSLSQRGANIGSSIELFRQAIAIDSLYAEAWSGLSMALALAPYFRGVSFASVADSATRAANRALQLDSTLAEPRVARGIVLEHMLRWDDAEAEFSAAVAADPNDVEARVQFGRLLLIRSRIAAAQSQFTKALERDPASALVLSWVSYAWYLEGELDTARVYSDRAMLSNAQNVSTVLNRAFLMLTRDSLEEARTLADSAPPYSPQTLFVLAKTGDTATVREQLARMAEDPTAAWLESARFWALLGLGDTVAAFRAMERATAKSEAWPMFVHPRNHLLDGVRGNPQYQAALRKLGL